MKIKDFKKIFDQFYTKFIITISLFIINKREKIFYLKKIIFI